MNNLISILITNYNKSQYLKKSLNSLMGQSFKNFEIIIFDDKSIDKSIEIINQFKKVKLIQNSKKKKTPPINQINGIIGTFKKSNGNIICLMDADDYFDKKKLLNISDFFIKNKNSNILFNYPKTFRREKFKIKNKINKHIWPTIFPTSCISFRRSAFAKFIKNLSKTKFDRLEIDARVAIFSKFYMNEYNIIKKNLTIYNFDPEGISSKIPKYSTFWWIRRKQGFEYLKLILKKKKIKFKHSFDYYITLFFFSVLKKLS